jgi:hypothetical protein
MVESDGNIQVELLNIEDEIGTLPTNQGTTGISSDIKSNPDDGE